MNIAQNTMRPIGAKNAQVEIHTSMSNSGASYSYVESEDSLIETEVHI